MSKEFQMWGGGGCFKKSSIVRGSGWIGKYKSYYRGGHYIQLWGYELEEEKRYNYQCRELKLMSKDIMT